MATYTVNMPNFFLTGNIQHIVQHLRHFWSQAGIAERKQKNERINILYR